MPPRLRLMLSALAGVAALWAVLSRAGKRWLGRRHQVGDAVLDHLRDDTRVDRATDAVRSIQSGEVVVPAAVAERLWTPESLERLARTYWRVPLPRRPGHVARRRTRPEPRSGPPGR